MSVLDRSALVESPLADLHMIASELGLDGFRRLRKDDLIAAILERGGAAAPAAAEASGEDAASEERPRRTARRRPGRGRSRRAAPEPEADAEEAPGDGGAGEDDEQAAPPRRERARRGGRGRSGAGADAAAGAPQEAEQSTVEGVVELLGNGSGFVRVSPPDPSEGDVYVSAAQIRRCELVSGDRVAGPVRPPRRSERYPSLVRVDTINGTSADEVAEGTPYDDLPASFPSERIALGADDPTLKAIEWLTPFGKGSRVVITGPARSGKTEALRRLAAALAGRDGLEVALVLAGARPEEIADWGEGPLPPVVGLSFAASPDAQASAVDRALEPLKRVAARGGDVVLLLDGLEHLSPAAARKTLAAARNLREGGSLTIVATVPAPVGGETTVIALDAELASTRRFPALDLVASGTIRPELLVGEPGAEAIAKARGEAVG